MRQFLPPLRLVGAESLRDGLLHARSIALDAGRITKGPLPEVDLTGYYVLPGIVDLSGPAPFLDLGLPDAKRAWRDLDKTAASAGVTTVFAKQEWSWASGSGKPEIAQGNLMALTDLRPKLGTDVYAQLHVETHMMDWADIVKTAVDGSTVKQVMFSNRLSETLNLAELDPEARARQATLAGLSEANHLERLRSLSKRGRDVPRFLCNLAEAFDKVGVLYGSQADPDGETREFFSMIGARLCLKPLGQSGFGLARAVGDPVLLSATDVLTPEETRAEFSTAEAVSRYKSSALVSGGDVNALAGAAFAIADRGLMTLEDAWALISSRPAEIGRLPDRGTLDYGKRADLVVINAQNRQIEATIANGCLTYLSGEAANRFLETPAGFGHAAE